jgi:hypothetical protein
MPARFHVLRAAITGILAGAGCASLSPAGDGAPVLEVPVAPIAPTASTPVPSDSARAIPTSVVVVGPPPTDVDPPPNEKQACSGAHACKGQNACKGQGECKTNANACKGQNQCKGLGGCKSP